MFYREYIYLYKDIGFCISCEQDKGSWYMQLFLFGVLLQEEEEDEETQSRLVVDHAISAQHDCCITMLERSCVQDSYCHRKDWESLGRLRCLFPDLKVWGKYYFWPRS